MSVLCSHGTCMYSGVVYVLPSRTTFRGGVTFIVGAVLDVDELSGENDAGFRRCASVAKSTSSAGGPSTRRASMSF